MSNMVAVVVFAPLAGAVAVLLCGAGRPRAARRMAIAFAVATLLAAVGVAVTFAPQSAQETTAASSASFITSPAWQVDGINVWLFLLSALLTHSAILITPGGATSRNDLFFALIMLLTAGLMGLFAAGNLVWLFVGWEVSRLALYFLIGGWGGTDRRQAAIKFFLFTLVGSGLVFVGCGLLVLSHYWMSGSLELTLNISRLIEELPQLAAANSENDRYWAGVRPWVFAAIGLGFAIHVPLFPLHTWLQDAAVESPTAGMLLLCGVWLKIGVYGWLRLLLPLFPELCADFAGYFLYPAAIGAVYGVMLGLVQDDMKRMAANLTVSYASLSVLGLFSLTSVGIEGGLLSLCSHGLSMGVLVCVTGALFDRYRTREAEAYSGLAGRFPRLTAVTFIGVASLIALPATSGFVATVLVMLGIGQVHPGFVITGLAALLLTVWCFARVMQRVFWGTLREPVINHPSWKPPRQTEDAPSGDLNLREVAAVVPLILAILCLGLAPQVFIGHTETSVARIIVVPDADEAAR